MVLLAAFTVGVQNACWILAVGLVGAALARLATSRTPKIRSRAFDVAAFLFLAVLLVYCANWGDTPAI